MNIGRVGPFNPLTLQQLMFNPMVRGQDQGEILNVQYLEGFRQTRFVRGHVVHQDMGQKSIFKFGGILELQHVLTSI